MKISLLITALLLLGLSGCKKEDSASNELSPVYFQYEYINYAWVKRHEGWFVNRDGKVVAYKLPAGWRDVDETNKLKLSDLESNLSRAISQVALVDKKEMEELYERVPDLKNCRIIESSTYMADAGIAALYAWYPAGEDAVERVLISQSGDITRWSDYRDLELFLDWFSEIGEEVGDFWWFRR